MSKKKIVVVMGGTSTEAEVSRRSGAAILSALKERGFNAAPLELNPMTFAEDIKALKPDIVFNALHGKFGEDGIVQGVLKMLDIPFTGSDILASALTMNKAAAKRLFFAEGIATPQYRVYLQSDDLNKAAEEILHEFSLPVVIKAAEQGSSIGVFIVERAEDVAPALKDALSFGNEALAEAFVNGRELTATVFGDEKTATALPLIEITTISGRYDYNSKYTVGASSHIVPAPLPDKLTAEIKAMAEKTFLVCGCKGVARVDFMLDENNSPYVIEVNSVPGMTATSLVPDAARAAGLDFPALCEKILIMAGFDG